MLKQIMFIFSILFCVSFTGLAQEEPKDGLKDPHEKNDSVKVQKVDESNEISAKDPWNKICPVQGEEVEADSPTVEYDGKVYAFCCPGCDTKFAKNPEKYAKNLSEDGKKFVGRK